MQVLLVSALRWILRHLLSLMLIVAILLLGRAVWGEWQNWQSISAELEQVNEAEATINDSLKKLAVEINLRAASLRTAVLTKVDDRIAAVDSEIARKQSKRDSFGGLSPIIKGGKIVEAQLKILQVDSEIELLRKERAWLQDVKLERLPGQSKIELEKIRKRHVDSYNKWKKIVEEIDALKKGHPIRSRIPGTAEHQQLQALEYHRAQFLNDTKRADDDYKRQKERMSSEIRPPTLEASPISGKAIEDLLRPLRIRRSELSDLERVNWIEKSWRPVKEVLPQALGILLGVILMPIAIKALFYFVLAPLAARQPPNQLLPDIGGVIALETGGSSISQAITVDSAHELLVHPEFLQSASITGEKSTQWLLNSRFALTSLSAGMAGLTRVRCDAPESVVISAAHNVLAEIGVLNLPAGCAVVMQPHNLVGVVQRRDEPLRITAHWRLTSLHAWLTLQLRYLVLHGPARLIVQGYRGVQLELATGGRAINQAATIAFSANLQYSTRRSETFAAYLFGQQELLKDCFGSPHEKGVSEIAEGGFFVYEMAPHVNRKASVAGRGLEGLTDSMLKVFGI